MFKLDEAVDFIVIETKHHVKFPRELYPTLISITRAGSAIPIKMLYDMIAAVKLYLKEPENYLVIHTYNRELMEQVRRGEKSIGQYQFRYIPNNYYV